MLEIKCPYCGNRSQNEFSYGGDADIKRPELGKEISDKEWDDFVYLRRKVDNHKVTKKTYGERRQLTFPRAKSNKWWNQHMHFH